MTQDEIIEMLRASCDKDKVDPEQNGFWVVVTEELVRFAKLVAQHEREACAKVCEEAISNIWEFHPEYVNQVGRNVCINLAAAIRARGQA